MVYLDGVINYLSTDSDLLLIQEKTGELILSREALLLCGFTQLIFQNTTDKCNRYQNLDSLYFDGGFGEREDGEILLWEANLLEWFWGKG